VNAWVLVVLRIVLNTVRLDQPGVAALGANNANAFPGAVAGEFFVSARSYWSLTSVLIGEPPPPPPTLDEIDRERHREINLKGVSGLMLNTLKWFKVSRACPIFNESTCYVFIPLCILQTL